MNHNYDFNKILVLENMFSNDDDVKERDVKDRVHRLMYKNYVKQRSCHTQIEVIQQKLCKTETDVIHRSKMGTVINDY